MKGDDAVKENDTKWLILIASLICVPALLGGYPFEDCGKMFLMIGGGGAIIGFAIEKMVEFVKAKKKTGGGQR